MIKDSSRIDEAPLDPHMTKDFSVSASECVQSWTDVGTTHYHNVCLNLPIADLKWGAADWVLYVEGQILWAAVVVAIAVWTLKR